MIGVVQRDVPFVAHVELGRISKQVLQAWHVVPVHAVRRRPHPRLGANADWGARIESHRVAVVLFVRRDEDVAVLVEGDARLVTAA
ncbi:MAG: hypothetical protein E6I58_06810 [Chloroflexi bacterium]|nr:MAG: hypothetical protein E6I58_06810 [Chloroflexota bacterium]